MPARWPLCAPLLAATLLSGAPAASADPPPQPPSRAQAPHSQRLAWSESFRRPGLVDYLATAFVLTGVLFLQLEVPEPDEPGWKGGILFDDASRDALNAPSNRARQRASLASDVLVNASMLQPWVIDGLFVPLVTDHGNLDVAWNMTVLNAEAIGTARLLTVLGKDWIARERPSTPDCERDPAYDDQCDSSAYASFPSGHTSTAFASAGLTCAHHQSLPLYGHATADGAACALAVSLATTTGMLRIVADRHYATDVLAGAALGFGAGYALPAGLYYHAWGGADAGTAGWLRVLPSADGIHVLGAF